MCLCKFGQNLPIGSEDRVQIMSNADANADGRDPHQKQYVPLPTEGGGYNTGAYLMLYPSQKAQESILHGIK